MSKRRSGESRSNMRDAVSYIFAFFLSLALLGAMVLVTLRVGLMTPGGLASALDQRYYELVLDYAKSEARHYTLPTGINPSVLDDVFTYDEVERDAKGIIVGEIDGSGYKPNTKALRERVVKNVSASFATDGVAVGEGSTADEIIKGYADDIVNKYVESIKLPGLDAIVQVRSLYLQYFPVALVCVLAFAVVMCLIIFRLHSYPHRSLRFVAYAFGGAALMGFVLPCVGLMSGFFTSLVVRPEYFHHFCVMLIEHVLKLCMMGAGVLLIPMLAIVFIVGRLRQSAIHRHGHSHHHG